MSAIARATTIVLLGGLALGSATLIYRAAKPVQEGQGFETYVYLRDAQGLPVGGSVKIAGIVVGEVASLAIENGQARIGLRLRDDVVLWDDAYATKKASSALADNYLEIMPGGPDPMAPSDLPHRRLRSGEPIPRVIESATTDRVLRGLEHAIPRADDMVRDTDVFAEEARQWVAGPFSERLARLDRQITTGGLSDPLRRAADATARFDASLARAQREVHAAVPAVDRRLDSLVDDTALARDRVRSTNADLAAGLADLRRDLDRADEIAAQASTFLGELAEEDPDRQGTLAKLIDDPSLGDEIADTAAELRQSSSDLDRLRATIGLRSEWNLLASTPRFYVTMEVTARRGQFYNIEVEKGPWGDVPELQLRENPDGTFTKRTAFVERARFTAQFGQRLGRFALRAGLKESMFGVGADALLGGGRLRLSIDAMENSFSRTPRIKVAAALEVFRSIYVLGGIDDALVPGGTLDIRSGGAGVPRQFERLRYGRDYQLGFDLRFTDRDVGALLRLYGAFLAGLFAS